MKQFCCGRKTLEKTFRLLSVCRGLVKVEGDGARLVRAFSRWQKVGQKGPRDAADDELRRVAGRPGGAAGGSPPSPTRRSRSCRLRRAGRAAARLAGAPAAAVQRQPLAVAVSRPRADRRRGGANPGVPARGHSQGRVTGRTPPHKGETCSCATRSATGWTEQALPVRSGAARSPAGPRVGPKGEGPARCRGAVPFRV